MIMESTYGDRDHEVPESYTEALAQLIDDTFARGGNVVIPSFAVGRTQELLYFLREIKDERLVKTYPDFQVCVDSPWPPRHQDLRRGPAGLPGRGGHRRPPGGRKPVHLPGLTLVQSTDESKALNMDPALKSLFPPPACATRAGSATT